MAPNFMKYVLVAVQDNMPGTPAYIPEVPLTDRHKGWLVRSIAWCEFCGEQLECQLSITNNPPLIGRPSKHRCDCLLNAAGFERIISEQKEEDFIEPKWRWSWV